MSAKGQSATSAGESPMSERSPKADIELSRVSVAENTGAVFLNGPSLLWNDGFPALELGRDLFNPLRCEGLLLG